MSTFVLIHGAGDGSWAWHLVAAELTRHGHDVIVPDLPADDDSATLEDYADTVIEEIGQRRDIIVAGHSFGAFTAPLVADRLSVKRLVLVAGMIPRPGESPDQWWSDTDYARAVRAQAALDGGLTGNPDPLIGFYHDVPRELADEAQRRERNHPSGAATREPWPLAEWPEVPTRVVLCTEDRLFPPDFMRGLAGERLGVVPDDIRSSHCVALSQPVKLADILESYAHDSSLGRLH